MDLLVISGKDINEAGGHGRYVKAMCLAAIGAGYMPHIFYVGRHTAVFETDYGRVHQAATPLRHVIRSRPGEVFRSKFVPVHLPIVKRQVERFLRPRSGEFIAHGVGPWGAIGVDIAHRMSTTDRSIVPIVTTWSTVLDEHRGRRQGATSNLGLPARFRVQAEYRWMKAMVVPQDIRAITGSARVVVNYESVAKQVRAIPGHAPITILPYATADAFDDPPDLRPPPDALKSLKPAHAPLLVSVSRHDPRKGVDVLIQALKILRERGVAFRVCMVGRGPLLAAHRRLASVEGVADTTSIVGFVPDPIAYLQHADVFVLPSIQEGSGSLSMLEAMQLGRAIVASDVDGIPEDVTDGDSALLAPPGDASALANRLEQVLIDEGLRHRLGRRAREVFEARFSAEIFSRSVGDLYRELLQAPSADR